MKYYISTIQKGDGNNQAYATWKEAKKAFLDLTDLGRGEWGRTVTLARRGGRVIWQVAVRPCGLYVSEKVAMCPDRYKGMTYWQIAAST